MRSLVVVPLAALSFVALSAAACGGEDPLPPDQAAAEGFDPANFDDPTTIDNEWLPLEPGTKLVYEGTSLEDEERVPRRVEYVVTDLTKEVGGVRSIVVWALDYASGELVEAELSLFAQDNDGNVWHPGEYPEEYEEGEIVDSPAWFHGLGGAEAGIAMAAVPELGAPDYPQGYAPPPVNWVDRAEVHEMGIEDCVPYDCFEDVLVMREFEPDKPDASQLKYYARGLGNIRVGWLGGKDENKEVLELVQVVQLGPEEMDEVRAQALKLEASGYRTSKNVYGKTPPAEHTLSVGSS